MNDIFAIKSPSNEQQQLLDVIWNDDLSTELFSTKKHRFNAQGINIYRRNLLANAQRALSITFPTVFELLDSDVSAALVKQFLQTSPPKQGDWAQWGSEFANFITASYVCEDYPYLTDCTSLDWSVHCALHGSDQTFNQGSLEILGRCEPEHIFIAFNHNVQLIKTSFPIAEIFDAHHHENENQRKAALNNANQYLSSALVDHLVMIYRPEFQPHVARLTSSEGRFTQSLIDGYSLAQSLDAINGNDGKEYGEEHVPDFSFQPFPFQDWLLNAIENNLIHYFKESHS
ncbi:DNA-binding domain-containing protein [Moritella sp. Urea-trap-13]|uniref:HvfC/BufC N-terminal domain-containing protein n=1 Tax=Moritella sp. Urea-trap-13 TaxID=2058327 RepID=UPI001E41A171|nr:DNA-binding domain-containing protein [Moritella sp. Urea-trap-13]